MKSKIVNLKEVAENNPTLCLSAQRYLGKCYKCPIFQRAFKNNKCNIYKTLKQLKCHPILDKNQIEILLKQADLLKKKKSIDKEYKSFIERVELSDI